MTRLHIRSQRVWGHIGELRRGGFLAHRAPRRAKMSQKSSARPVSVPAEKLEREFFAPRASTIPPTARFAASRKSPTQRKVLKILESKGQRRSLSRFPFLRHFPLRKHALSPDQAWKFPSICGLFARNLDGAGAEWSGFFSPNRGILSKA